MRIVGHTVLALLVLALTLNCATGQGKKSFTPPGWSKLTLTTEQKAKLLSVHNDFAKKIMALEDQIVALKAAERTEHVKILTPEQKKLLGKLLGIDDAKVEPKEDPKKPEEKK